MWVAVVAPALLAPSVALAQLASWHDGAAKQSIVRFVADVTTAGAPTFVAPEDRVAVFDNDGTLRAEQPMYFQAIFMIDQVRAAAPSTRSRSRTASQSTTR